MSLVAHTYSGRVQPRLKTFFSAPATSTAITQATAEEEEEHPSEAPPTAMALASPTAIAAFTHTFADFPTLKAEEASVAPSACCSVHSKLAAIAAAAATTAATPKPTLPVRRSSLNTLPLVNPRARPAYVGVSTTCSLPRASFWNTRCSCIFSSLPDEILLFNVFDFLATPELCTLAAVCSRWRFLSTDPMLWRQLDLSKHSRVITENVFDNVLARVGDHVNSLKLCNLKLLPAESLQRLGRVHLANNGGLSTLHLCSIKAADFASLSILLDGPTAHTLRELSLFGCVNVDDACIRLIRQKCVHLEDLSVRGCLLITDAAWADEADEAHTTSPEPPVASPMQIELMEDDSDLIALTRSDSSVSVSSAFSTGSVASAASSSSSSSSPSSQVATVGRFAHLTALNVANCKLLTEAGLVSIFRASPLLQKLNLHALNPTDAMLDALTTDCAHLRELHLSSANPFGGNLHLTDVGVEYIAARLPDLTSLNLQGSSQLTDACMHSLLTRCRQLAKLNLGGVFKLTDAAVEAMCAEEHTTKLTHLSLFQCVRLTDASLELIANRMPTLQHLDIHSCAGLTDTAMALLAEPHSSTEIPPLASLDEDDTAPATPVRASAYRLPQLKSIDIGSCRKISKEIVAQMKQRRPELAITHY